MNGQPAQTPVWQIHETPEKRVYYYNPVTKVTRWDKPEELMDPMDRALLGTPWKVYMSNGKPYYARSDTNETVWDIPPEIAERMKQYESVSNPPAAPTPTFVAGGPQSFVAGGPPSFVAGGPPSFVTSGHGAPAFVAGGMSSHPPQHLQLQKHDKYQPNERIGQDRQIAYRVDSERIPNSVALNTQTDPEYNSFEEAEAAFKKLLKRVNARPEWTWPETVRATVEDSQYRALKDPKDRKKAFEKYVVELRVQEKDKEKDRLAKLRSDFASMLRSHPEIKHYTRWKTARPIIKDELIFQSATSEDERKQLFQEYRVDLKKSHVSEEAENQKSALGELKEILGALNLEPYTRWSSAQVVLESNTHVQSDKKFQSLTKLDILKAFDEHIKGLERSFNEQRQKQKRSKARRERQAREGFLVLLTQLRSEGKIDVASKWMTTLPLIEEDPRYHAMLGNSGSSPLDLFWDLVEEDERALRIKRNDAMDVLEDKKFEVTPTTSFEQFLAVMNTDRRTADLDGYAKPIFDRIRDRVVKRSEEEKHYLDRHQRRAVDGLRSRIKHLEPPVAVGDTWEQVRPRIENFEEYRLLDTDEARRSALDKHMRRLNIKEEDDRDRTSRDHRTRDRGDRVGHRERERNYQDGRENPQRHRRARTRSPEADPYEADRKKAQENRERQYRQAGSTTGLSPPHRRERDDRERIRDRPDRYDRGSRQASMSHYDRERREREAEREHNYVSRADPRDRGEALDYGDSRPGSVRRRRESDAVSPGSKRDNKRVRRSRTPAAPPTPAPEDPGLRSGSEEGELAED